MSSHEGVGRILQVVEVVVSFGILHTTAMKTRKGAIVLTPPHMHNHPTCWSYVSL